MIHITAVQQALKICTPEKFRNVFKQSLVIQLASVFVWYIRLNVTRMNEGARIPTVLIPYCGVCI